MPTPKSLLLVPISLALGTAAAAASTTLPPQKAGLWQTSTTITMVMNGATRDAPSSVTELCTDPQVQAMQQQRMSACGVMNYTGAGGTYTMHGSCPGPGGTMTIQGTITMTSDTAAHVVSDTTSPMFTNHLVADSKWLGPCPAGMKPGDLSQMRNGTLVKVGNMMQMPKPPQ